MRIVEILYLLAAVSIGIWLHILAYATPGGVEAAIFAFPNYLLLVYLCIKVFLIGKRLPHSDPSQKPGSPNEPKEQQ